VVEQGLEVLLSKEKKQGTGEGTGPREAPKDNSAVTDLANEKPKALPPTSGHDISQ
jgi:hypothetical protein